MTNLVSAFLQEPPFSFNVLFLPDSAGLEAISLYPEAMLKRFTDRLLREDVNMHGFILSCADRQIANIYWHPFLEGQPHRMYSVSKTMTGIAIGMLVDDGVLSLDQAICGFFPDLLPPDPPEALMRLNLRDMLRMAACYRKTAYRENIDRNWTVPFFNSVPDHEPGTVFCYDTGCSQVLAALVRRISGQEVMEFLDDRLFRPLGLQDSRFWLRDPSGCCQGGTGLCMSLRDLHRVSLCLLHGGEGLIPRWYTEEMGKKHIDTSLQEKKEEQYGYGWQCWRIRTGWAMYGMGGQLSVLLPDRQAVFSTIADTRLDPFGVQRIYDAFFDEIYPFLPDSEPAPPISLLLPASSLPDSLQFPDLPESTWLFPENNPLGLTSVRLTPVFLSFTRGTQTVRLPYARGITLETAWPGHADVPALVSAARIGPEDLRIRCFAIGNTPCGFDLILSINGPYLTIKSRCSSDPLTREYDGIASGILQKGVSF